MTDEAWRRGMNQLRACCKDRDMDDELRDERAACYRRDLGHLSDSRWLYAVEQARKGEWFPSIQDLLGLAERAPLDETRADQVLRERVQRGEPTSRITPPLGLYEALVVESPIRADEGPMAYIVRIAESAGVPQGGNGGAWPLALQAEKR